MKKNKAMIIVLISFISLIVISLILFLVFALNNTFKFKKFNFINFNFGNKISNNLLLKETYDGNLSKIAINTDSADIEVMKSRENNISVLVYADDSNISDYKVNVDNNILNINIESKKCIGFCFDSIKSKVVVYVPIDYSNNINIYNNYGDVSVGNLEKANITVDEDCGDVSIKSGDIVIVKNSYGDININKANKADIDEDCGDVEIDFVSDAIVNNSYGDISINNVMGYLDIENSCGDIEIENIELTRNSKIIDNLGDIKINNIKDVYIDAKTDLGDVDINNNYHKSDIVLKIENDCGDIEVNN